LMTFELLKIADERPCPHGFFLNREHEPRP
jgi:hypothetical protein